MVDYIRYAFVCAVALVTFWGSAFGGTVDTYIQKLTPLIDPAKLATLGERGANPRIEKAVAILEDARAGGFEISVVVSNAVVRAGYTNAELAKMTRESLVRNHTIATRLGALTPDGLAKMRHGGAATITRGPYKGDKTSVDHIVPRAIVPELDNVIANLELLPGRVNSSKGDKIGERQRDYCRKFYRAGLLSESRLRQILANHEPRRRASP